MTNEIEKLRGLSAKLRKKPDPFLQEIATNIDSFLSDLAASGEAVAGHQNDRGEPDVIWLQCHGDDDPAYSPNDLVDVTSDDVTWCWEKIFENDVKYIRADLVGMEDME